MSRAGKVLNGTDSEAKRLLSLLETTPRILRAPTFEDFLGALKKADQIDRDALLAYADAINRQHYADQLHTESPVLLHHGSPDQIDRFELVKGRRSHGFMGAEYQVDNQGVFLTDSKALAHHFGRNRADGSYKVYDVYANLDKMLDLTKQVPVKLKGVGLQMVNQYYGTQKTKLAQQDLWWLCDRPDFIAKIRELGYDAIKFKESRHNRRDDPTASTIMVLDMSKLLIKSQQNDKIQSLRDLWQHANGK